MKQSEWSASSVLGMSLLTSNPSNAAKQVSSEVSMWMYTDAMTGELTGQTVSANIVHVMATFTRAQNITKQEFQTYMTVPKDRCQLVLQCMIFFGIRLESVQVFQFCIDRLSLNKLITHKLP